ncbi:MAG: type II secretion system F family protein [Deltaproteobacteria bacterium]|nr:type II secretion system F family protein [Deltaproteobacteria bacterium]
MSFLLLTCCCGLLGAVALQFSYTSGRRVAEDVFFDLTDAQTSQNLNPRKEAAIAQGTGSIDSIARAEQRAARKLRTAIVLLTPALCIVVRAFFGVPSPAGLLVTAAVGVALGCLAAEAALRRRAARKIRQLEFYLPIVMERIVMAVQAGHDVLAALKTILDLEAGTHAKRAPTVSPFEDPVTQLLSRVYKLAESGVGLEHSLHEVAASVACPAVRHAFIHLAQAHKEGGELVMPLRELSDSTQLYYQESVEEEIAKLPVRATVPLLCTFAGLIIFFLTAPMMQVLDITNKAMPK